MTNCIDIASAHDIPRLCELINIAYRGQQGWTTEHHLVAGDRIKPSHLHSLLSQQHGALLVNRSISGIDACIHIATSSSHAHIGTFAVMPTLQGCGIGTKLLNAAEAYAVDYQMTICEVAVLAPRTELIAFYQRRGYQTINKQEQYPIHLDVGQPAVDNLKVVYLQKSLK